MSALNLARRPFVNNRPVTRVALLLWTLGGLLLLGNVTLFYSYLSGSTEMRAELARKRSEVTSKQQEVERLKGELGRRELGEHNEQVQFLNRKIAERTFSWSLLFDRLAEVLPDDVRIVRLQPAAIGGDERPGFRPAPSVRGQRRRTAGSSDQVPLIIQGEAKSDQAMLDFLDNLFAHAAFDDPDISRESRDEENGGVLQFDVRVTYLPRAAAQSGSVEDPLTVVEEETPTPTPPAEETGEPEVE